MKRMLLFALSGVAVAVSPAVAEEIALDTEIRAVTVYPQGAAITREGPVVVPAGNNVLVLSDIPQGIVRSSIRVGGMGDDLIQVQSVSVRFEGMSAADHLDRQRLAEEIEGLRDELRALDVQRAAVETRRLFISNLVNAGADGLAEIGVGEDDPGIDLWLDAWDTVYDGVLIVETALLEIDRQERAIREDIEALLAEQERRSSQPDTLQILIETIAAQETDLVLEVTYRMSDARWSPSYDVSLTTGTDDDATVEVIRRAGIFQNTGEDWTDVALTLSTTRSNEGPQPQGVYVMPLRTREYLGSGVADMPMVLPDFGDFRADHVVQAPVSIASGTERSIRIANDEATAHLFVEIAPRRSENAYLMAAFALDSEMPVLRGEANLFRDDVYVGRSTIVFTSAGAEIRLGFGVDNQVQAVWADGDRNTGEDGLLARVTFEEREYLATITNNHTRPIEIVVVDRVPVTDDERIIVERLPQMTEPTEENRGGTRGVVAWTYIYEPGETREIINAYITTWPVGLELEGTR